MSAKQTATAADETLAGAAGDDTLTGAAGNDTLAAGANGGSDGLGGPADDPLAEIRAQVAELRDRTEAAEKRAEDAEKRAEEAEARLSKFDHDGDGKAGGRRKKGDSEPGPMAPREQAERSPGEKLGDGLVSHLVVSEQADSVDRLAALFQTSAEAVREAAKTHAGLVLVGDQVRIAA